MTTFKFTPNPLWIVECHSIRKFFKDFNLFKQCDFYNYNSIFYINLMTFKYDCIVFGLLTARMGGFVVK